LHWYHMILHWYHMFLHWYHMFSHWYHMISHWFHMITYVFHIISCNYIWFHIMLYNFVWFHMISHWFLIDFILISCDFIWFHAISYWFRYLNKHSLHDIQFMISKMLIFWLIVQQMKNKCFYIKFEWNHRRLTKFKSLHPLILIIHLKNQKVEMKNNLWFFLKFNFLLFT
jgi:hypothetical protein